MIDTRLLFFSCLGNGGDIQLTQVNNKEWPLRTLTIVFLIGFSVAFCQSTFKRPDAEQIVQKMLSDPMHAYSSWEEKDLNKLGDASEVVATKLLDGKTVDANEIKPA